MNKYIVDTKHNKYMLSGSLQKNGFDCWRHSFIAKEAISGTETAFFIDMYVLNPMLKHDSVMINQFIDHGHKKKRSSYVLIKAGRLGEDACQIHNFYPSKDLLRSKKQLNLQVASCKLTDNSFSGAVSLDSEDAQFAPEGMNEVGSLQWDLHIEHKKGFLVKNPYLFKKRAGSTWNVCGASTYFSGSITCNNKRYIVIPEGSYGYTEKIWGNSFSEPWLRISCNKLTSQFDSAFLKESYLVIGSHHSKGKGTSRICANAFIRDILYRFNFDSFGKRNSVTINSAEYADFYTWSISALSKEYVLDVNVQCNKSDLLTSLYELPHGNEGVLRYSKGFASGEMKLYKKSGRILETIDVITLSNVYIETGITPQD